MIGESIIRYEAVIFAHFAIIYHHGSPSKLYLPLFSCLSFLFVVERFDGYLRKVLWKWFVLLLYTVLELGLPVNDNYNFSVLWWFLEFLHLPNGVGELLVYQPWKLRHAIFVSMRIACKMAFIDQSIDNHVLGILFSSNVLWIKSGIEDFIPQSCDH